MRITVKQLGGLAVLLGLLHAGSAWGQVAAGAAGYNPITGTGGRAGAAYNPYTGASASVQRAYNPYTGRAGYRATYRR